MRTEDHRDDLRIARALSALGSLDLGPEPVLQAPSTGRARSRGGTRRRGLFAGLAVAGPLAVAIVAVMLHTTAQKPTVAKGLSKAPPASTAAAADLEGTLWYLTTIAGTHAQPGGQLRFGKAGKLSGSTGCNDFRGTYAQSGSSLTITIESQTAKRCAPALEEQEVAVNAALPKVASFSNAYRGVQSLSASDPLTLLDRSGQTLLDYAQGGPASLAGPAWKVTSINTGQARIPVVGNTLTATFSQDENTMNAIGGTVAGSVGCNTYSAPFQLSGARLTVGPVAMTRKHCRQPAGVTEQQAAFLKALAAPMTVMPTSRNITLSGDIDPTTGAFGGELTLELVDL
jgi:heat shock protein HslJ